MEQMETLTGIIQPQMSTTYLTHNFHPYAAKFIPPIPRSIIQKYTARGETVLDPFCGSGTSLVEAKILGRKSIGVDINPIGAFMSKVKTTKITTQDISDLSRIMHVIQENLSKYPESNHNSNPYPVPSFHNRDHWFKQERIIELAIIHGTIIKEAKSEAIRDFLLLGFASIIVNCSNQESETRYAAIDKNQPRGYSWKVYENKISDMVKRIKQFNSEASDEDVKVFCADSRNLDCLDSNSVDLIVTSPPYANTYDYYLYHKMRMFWLGLNWENAKINEIGSRLKHSSQNESIDSYLADMKACFKEFYRVLRPNKRFAIVLGDSVINGVRFDGAELVSKLAEETDFEIENTISYDLGKSSRLFNKAFRKKDKNEHILILKKVDAHGNRD